MTLVAIDGPAGSGKSTVAKAVAAQLGLAYLDTGAMYRAVAFAALRRGIDPEDVDPIAKLARGVEIEMGDLAVTVDGIDATIEIRGPEVTRAVSAVAANPGVRAELVERQREWAARHGGGVVEGRDIGTVVLPEADLKVYLTASDAVRAGRRSQEVLDLDYDTVAADIARRDHVDSTRSTSPLQVAADAVVLDTGEVGVEEVVESVLKHLREKTGAAAPAEDALEMGGGHRPSGTKQQEATDPERAAGTSRFVPSDKRARGEVKETWAQKLMYAVVRAWCAAWSRLIWRTTVSGRKKVPKRGGFILSAGHRSNIDTPLVAIITRRKLRFMGKDSMWKYPFTDWFFSNMGGFPVHRGVPDREALRNCEALLRAGQPVVVFPEGTRHTGPLIEDMFEGPAYLAMKCQVPILPVGIGGSERAMPKGAKFVRLSKIHISVGDPIPPPPMTAGGRVSRKAVHQLTETLQARLQELFDDAQVRAGA